MDTLTNVIHALKSNGIAKKLNPLILVSLFLDKKFVSTKSYDLPNKDQMAEALEIFNDFENIMEILNLNLDTQPIGC